MGNDLQPIDNNSKRSEKITKLATTIISTFGPIGSIVSTIVNESISSAHEQRIIDFLNELYSLFKKQNKAIGDIQNSFEKMMSDNCNTLVFEQAVKASLETNSTILHHCYAFFIFNNVKEKKLEDVQHERLFRLIASLSEYEIIMLIGYSKPRFIGRDSEFDDEYEDIVFPRSRTIGSPEEDVIFNAFFDQYIISLEQKGLITRRPDIKQNNLKFSIQYTSPQITTIGELVVEAIYDEEFMLKKDETINEEKN